MSDFARGGIVAPSERLVLREGDCVLPADSRWVAALMVAACPWLWWPPIPEETT